MNLNKIFKYIIIILGILSIPTFCNNLTLSTKVYLVDQDTSNNSTYLKFNLSWDNSWRTSSAPNNYDAVWVFAKYRITNSTIWKHLTLSSNSTDHFIVENNLVSPEFIVGETNSIGKGVFIQRVSDGSGNITWEGVKLKWDYGSDTLTDNDSVEVKVFAIEMVYIPEGSFYVGDGTVAIADSGGQLHVGGDNTSSFQITSENSITLGGTLSSNLANNNAIGMQNFNHDDFNDSTTQILSATFPKGFSNYYIMKYEITQGQYVDFLNTLTRTQQESRIETDLSGTSTSDIFVMSATITDSMRNSIKVISTFDASPAPITFYNDLNNDGTYGDGKEVACNFLHPFDGLAYADWAALRPISELEYEKSCRGIDTSIIGEYAWGSTNIYSTNYTLVNGGTSSETMLVQSTDTNGNCLYTSTSGSISGPARSGIFAISANRILSGASYYGVMELSGNLYEQTVSIGNSTGRNFIGSSGDGELNIDGDPTNIDWPSYNRGTTFSNYIRMSFRGGSWGIIYPQSELQISKRIYANGIAAQWSTEIGGFVIQRHDVDGFRVGRSL